jgi:hypothetical protein
MSFSEKTRTHELNMMSDEYFEPAYLYLKLLETLIGQDLKGLSFDAEKNILKYSASEEMSKEKLKAVLERCKKIAALNTKQYQTLIRSLQHGIPKLKEEKANVPPSELIQEIITDESDENVRTISLITKFLLKTTLIGGAICLGLLAALAQGGNGDLSIYNPTTFNESMCPVPLSNQVEPECLEFDPTQENQP